MPRCLWLLVLAVWSCGPVTTEFFGDPPVDHDLLGTFSDTAVVRNLDTDSVSAEGVRWLVYSAAETGIAGRADLARAMESLGSRHVESVPDSLLEGDPALDLWNRLSGQGLVQRLNIARADALTISSMKVDTALVSPGVDSASVEARWVIVVSDGQAWLDPSAGIRD
jgi:hypothetical protein